MGWSLQAGVQRIAAPTGAEFAGFIYPRDPYYAEHQRVGDDATDFCVTGETSGAINEYVHGVPSSITRSTRVGVPTYDDRDEFILDSYDLTPTTNWISLADGPASRVYGVSGMHAEELHVARMRHQGVEWWEVASNGWVATLGRTNASRVEGRPRHLKMSGPSPLSIFSWHVEQVVDQFGNLVRFEYEKDIGSTQSYLSSIQYGGSATDETSLRYKIVLDYGNVAAVRNDAFSSYRSGFEVRTQRLCHSVLSMVQGGEDNSWLPISRLELEYLAADGNGTALLARVVRVGVDDKQPNDSKTQKAPPVTLTYSAWHEGAGSVIETGRGLSAPDLQANAELLDGEGMALPGVVLTSRKGHRFLPGSPAGQLGPTMPFSGAPGLTLSDPTVWLADMSGDGYADLAFFGHPAGYYAALPGVGWNQEPTTFENATSFQPGIANCRLADMDGDGRVDAIKIVADAFQVFFNSGQAGWSTTPAVALLPSDLRSIDLSSPWSRLADLSGDGPLDLVELKRNPDDGTADASCVTIRFWPHYGCGVFAEKALRRNLPNLMSSGGSKFDPFRIAFEPERLLLLDADGDGYDDVVYLDQDRIIVWLNRTGNGFSQPFEILLRGTRNDGLDEHHGPASSPAELRSIRAVDIQGAGTPAVSWMKLRGSVEPLLWTALSEGEKPYLLTGFDNGRGLSSKVEYRSSAHFAHSDRSKGRAWSTHLPFPVQVVARTEVANQYSGTIQRMSYAYHDGSWDGIEREFRGFGAVEVVEESWIDDALSGKLEPLCPASRKRLWYHVGLVGSWDVMQEPSPSVEYWHSDPQMLRPSSETSAYLSTLPPRARRRAYRALAGKVRRIEFYHATPSDDSDDLQATPISVQEDAYDVCSCSSAGRSDDTGVSGDPVVDVRFYARRYTDWRGGNDPKTRVEVVLNRDGRNRALARAALAFPRGSSPEHPSLDSAQVHARIEKYSYARTSVTGMEELNRVSSRVTFEYVVDASGRVEDIVLALRTVKGTAPPQRAIRTYYDGKPLVGEPLGVFGKWGLLTRVDVLVHNEATFEAVFRDRPIPAWLGRSSASCESSVESSGSYPDSFLSAPHMEALYYWSASEGAGLGLWAREVAYTYSVQNGGQNDDLLGRVDQAGVMHTFAYKDGSQQPSHISIASRLVHLFEYDPRNGFVARHIDPNGRVSETVFTPLGLPLMTLYRGVDGSTDTEHEPGAAYAYGLAPEERRDIEGRVGPTWVHERLRLQRAGPVDPKNPLYRERRDYRDGAGRPLQTFVLKSAQEEDVLGRQDSHGVDSGDAAAGSWLSGLTRAYDAYGRVVEEYEPFFASDPRFRSLGELNGHPRTRLYRTADGRIQRIVRPDGTERSNIFGSIGDFGRPSEYSSNPWEIAQYDEDDNAAHTHPDNPPWQSSVACPLLARVDEFERVCAVTQVTQAIAAPYVAYDYDRHSGALRQVTETVQQYVAYRSINDLLGRPWLETTVSAGEVLTIPHPSGQPLLQENASGACVLTSYDVAHRPLVRWHRLNSNEVYDEVFKFAYGDQPDAPEDAAARNLRGQRWKVAGRDVTDTFKSYSDEGYEKEVLREWHPQLPVPSDEVPGHPQEIRGHGGGLRYQASLTSSRDRLGNVTDLIIEAPGLPLQKLSTLRRTNGDIQKVRVEAGGETINLIEQDCDEYGRRIVLLQGLTVTRWKYGRDDLRLQHIQTLGGGSPTQELLQEATLTYSASGFLRLLDEETSWRDGRTAHSFTYDSLRRLVSAEALSPKPSGVEPWKVREPAGGVEHCTLRFEYDLLGNLRESELTFGSDAWIRALEFEPGTNKLRRLTTRRGSTTQTDSLDYETDASGRVTIEGRRRFEWNAESLLSRAHSVGTPSESAAAYAYDDAGVTAVVLSADSMGKQSISLYFRDSFRVHILPVLQGRKTKVASVLRAFASDRRGDPPVANIHVAESGECEPEYILTDALGNTRALFNSKGDLAPSDYSPYGEGRAPTSQVGLEEQESGFAGGDQSRVSGLTIFGKRPYAPWLYRFVSPDSAADQRRLHLETSVDVLRPPYRRRTVPHIRSLSPYVYAANSPLTLNDRDGRWPSAKDINDAGKALMAAGAIVFLLPGGQPIGTGAAFVGGVMKDLTDDVVQQQREKEQREKEQREKEQREKEQREKEQREKEQSEKEQSERERTEPPPSDTGGSQAPNVIYI